MSSEGQTSFLGVWDSLLAILQIFRLVLSQDGGFVDVHEAKVGFFHGIVGLVFHLASPQIDRSFCGQIVKVV